MSEPTIEDLTEIISSGDRYVTVTMMPDGRNARMFLSGRTLSANVFFTRDELVRVHEALGRLLRLTGTSLADAVERERARA